MKPRGHALSLLLAASACLACSRVDTRARPPEPDGAAPAPRAESPDALADARDACPDDSRAPADGCPPRDRDFDLIGDRDDACVDQPETRNGFQDGDGCPDELPEEVRTITGAIKGVAFAPEGATLRRRSHRVLNRVVDVLQSHADVRIEISGHTDNLGTADDNDRLSQQRAEAVRDFLINRGIDPSRMETRGAGMNEPTGCGGRECNRRIEFTIITRSR